MRENELLIALAQADPGIECLISSNRVTITTLYKPHLRSLSQSLFSTAFELAKLLLDHSECPPKVKKALEQYELHTDLLRL